MGPSSKARRRSTLGVTLRILGWMVPLAGFLLTGWAWAWSSPVGSAPDDDYHMASIWCPTPLEDSGCVVGYESDGSPIVRVPGLVTAGVCWAFDPQKSASCQDGVADEANTARVDNGGYPGGYYDFMHVLVGSDVQQTVYSMRMFNVGLATLLIGLTVAINRRTARLPIVGGLAIGLVPLGIFLVSSLNPSSWAIVGVCVAWGATHALIGEGQGLAGRILSMVLLISGATIAAVARSDAAAFIVVVTAGYLFFQYRRRMPWTTIVTVAIASIIGFIGFMSGGQSDALTGSWGSEGGPLQGASLLLHNIRELPFFFGGMFGYQWGLGWLDTGLLSITTVTMLCVVGGAFFVGTQQLSWRKGLILLMLAGAASTLALWTLQINDAIVGQQVQPRYLLPLIIVFCMVLFIDAARPDRSIRLSLSTRWFVWAFVVIANCFALQRNIRRYTTGTDLDGFNLNLAVEWWVAPVQPMTLWVLGTLGFAMFAAALLYVGRPPEAEGPAAEDLEPTPKRATAQA